MLSIAFGERRASLMYDNEEFSGQWQAGDFSLGAPSDSFARSHRSLSRSLHTCRQSEGVHSSVLLKCLHFQQQNPHSFLSSSIWKNRDIRVVPLAHSKSLRKKRQLWDLLKSSLGLSFTDHSLQRALSPQLLH